MMKKNRKVEVVIVGGGASGLAAAVELRMSSTELSVLVIEKMKEPGRKLRATGSGRCNISNTEAPGVNRIMQFFDSILLSTKIYENGLVYPFSESAADVVDLLVTRAESLGVEFVCGEEVTDIEVSEKKESGDTSKNGEDKISRFKIISKYKDKKGEQTAVTYADYVVLATGGKSGPMYGTTGDGYRLARNLGHSIVTPVPALTGIECIEWDESYERIAQMLAGTRTDAIVSLYRHKPYELPCYEAPFFAGYYIDYDPEFMESGEVQFTKYGLSGICIFNMTRRMRFNRDEGESLDDFFIKLNLYPGGRFSEYIGIVRDSAFADESLEAMMRTVLKKPIVKYLLLLLKESGFDIDKTVEELSVSDIKTLCEVVHGLEFHATALRGWKDAQVTSGGVDLFEIDEETAESELVKGLYITGELADIDLPCGGFNLSNAWLTGLAAADDIALKSKSNKDR